ncbi:MAG: hypothetical protein ACK5XN_06410, partial [Bacteroidota bacterium]
MPRHIISLVSMFVMMWTIIFPTGDVSLYAQTTATPERLNLRSMVRADITLRDQRDGQLLQQLGIPVLSVQERRARVLVDMQQLAVLGTLAMEPHNLMSLNALDSAIKEPVMPRTLRPDQATTRASVLRNWAQSLGTQTRQRLATPNSTDSDSDGLSDLDESNWCTNPNRADSDGDGVRDADEVTSYYAWMRSERAQHPGTGYPFLGTPFVGPNYTSTLDCPDFDFDSVPDFVELLLGLNPNAESTDYDALDDGLELFGKSFCRNTSQTCGWGQFPRDSLNGVLMTEMPSYIKAPGNHPRIEAAPRPSIFVVPNSITLYIKSLSTTTQGNMTGNQVTYATTHTTGTEFGRTDTETWEDWVEVVKKMAANERALLAYVIGVQSVA